MDDRDLKTHLDAFPQCPDPGPQHEAKMMAAFARRRQEPSFKWGLAAAAMLLVALGWSILPQPQEGVTTQDILAEALVEDPDPTEEIYLDWELMGQIVSQDGL